MTYEAWRISYQSSEQAAQAAYKEWQKLVPCSGCAVQQGYVPVETLSATIKEPMSRFCPECGHVGEVGASHHDCCPDGSHAFMVPARWANELREGFKARFCKPQAQLAAVQQGAPNGWQMVPKVPTMEMIVDLMCTGLRHAEYKKGCSPSAAEVAQGYQAMLKSAPQPQATHPTQQGLEQGAARYSVVANHWKKPHSNMTAKATLKALSCISTYQSRV